MRKRLGCDETWMVKEGHIRDDNRSSRILLGESSDGFAMTIRFASKPPAGFMLRI